MPLRFGLSLWQSFRLWIFSSFEMLIIIQKAIFPFVNIFFIWDADYHTKGNLSVCEYFLHLRCWLSYKRQSFRLWMFSSFEMLIIIQKAIFPFVNIFFIWDADYHTKGNLSVCEYFLHLRCWLSYKRQSFRLWIFSSFEMLIIIQKAIFPFVNIFFIWDADYHTKGNLSVCEYFLHLRCWLSYKRQSFRLWIFSSFEMLIIIQKAIFPFVNIFFIWDADYHTKGNLSVCEYFLHLRCWLSYKRQSFRLWTFSSFEMLIIIQKAIFPFVNIFFIWDADYHTKGNLSVCEYFLHLRCWLSYKRQSFRLWIFSSFEMLIIIQKARSWQL